MGNIKKTISYLKRNGLLGTVRMSLQRLKEDRQERDYGNQRLSEIAGTTELKAQEKSSFKTRVTFSVVIPAYETREEYLKVLLDSILIQSYGDFEVIIADAGESSCVAQTVASMDDERLVYIKLEGNGGISENTNAALQKASGDVAVFADHDDFLEPDALYHLARAFEEGALMAYTDEDKYEDRGETGRYYRPNRKPDFNYDLLLSNNYISHLFAVRMDILRQAGYLRSSFDGAQDYDLILRCADRVFRETGFYEGRVSDVSSYIRHIPRVLYHWRVHESSTAENPESKSYAYEAGRRALSEHLKKRGLKVRVKHTEHLGFYRIEYADCIPEGELRYNIPPGLRIIDKKYRKHTAGIFQRKEVRAVVYRIVDRHGRVEDEPGRGNMWWDSGVMHRSAMPMDMDAPRGIAYCVRRHPGEGLVVYLPFVMFRRT